MDEEKLFYNAVAITLAGNPLEVRGLKKRCGDLFDSWKTAYELLVNDGRSPPDPIAEWERLENAGVRLLLFDDKEYPSLLKHIPDPPLGLYARGDLPQPHEACFAIVGTRRATTDGKSATQWFAREIASAGFVVVSGLAFGIDAAAHEGCLAANGRTIAILAGGLDKIYPAKNEWLARKILDCGGALVSEYPIGQPSYPDRFLERNRIVSGLSKGILVVEVPNGSGSLATARFALEQNRDVFVVPGPITHPNFFGSHSLIRQGATLVTKPGEILETYGIAAKDVLAKKIVAASDEEKQVLIALRSTSTALDVDKIIEMTKLEPQVANQTLSFLLLKQLVKETEAGYIIE